MKNKQLQRQMVSVEVAELGVSYVTLADLQAQLAELVKLYGADATVRREPRRYDDSEYIAVFVKREETDEEYQARVDAHDLQTARELEQYRQLAAKFGSLK